MEGLSLLKGLSPYVTLVLQIVPHALFILYAKCLLKCLHLDTFVKDHTEAVCEGVGAAQDLLEDSFNAIEDDFGIPLLHDGCLPPSLYSYVG